MNEIREKFNKGVSYIKREGITELVQWLETETDFFTSPASTNYHGNFSGGLESHSVNVLEFALTNFNFIIKKKPELESLKESVIICALFHDVCKVNTYIKEEKWIKDANNQWQKYIGYNVDDKFPLGHGEKSVYYINQYMKLTMPEILAVRFHMGFQETPPNGLTKYSYEKSFNEPLVKIIMASDILATGIEQTVDYKALASKK